MSYPQQYYPPAPPKASRGPVLLAAVGGFVVAAVIATVLVVTGVVGGSSGVGGDSDGIGLPKTLGSYVRFQDATRNQSSRAKTIIEARMTSDQRTASALSQAHDGAGAAVQSYTDQDLQTFFAVWAVRGPSPTPVVPVVDPKTLGLAVAPNYVANYGHSTCVINSVGSTPAGKTPDPDSVFVGYCQRSSDDLTVTVVMSGGGDLSHQPDKVAALVDQVWDGVS